MNTINLEGKLYGYEKKTLAIIAMLILVAGVMFYAGAKYEKKKIGSAKAAKTSNNTTSGTKASKKSKKQANPGTINPDGTTTPATDSSTSPNATTTTTPATTQTPVTTTTKTPPTTPVK